MSYIDAGYSIGLGVLFFFSVGLVLRRRRLERAVAVARRDETSRAERVHSESP